MSAELWHPLSAREAGDAGLREDISLALRGRLRAWLQHAGLSFPELAARVMLRLDVFVPDGPNASSTWPVHVEHSDDATLLDTVDAMLSVMPVRTFTGTWGAVEASHVEEKTRRLELKRDLADARSVYQVRRNGSGLERRVNKIATAMHAKAVSAAVAKPDAGSAAAQLQAANDALRALHPDPEKAYSQAIKAVESAAHAVIEPTNAKATLGTMLGAMRGSTAKFELAIPGKDGSGDVAPVVEMMTLLWEGQSSRHGAQTTTPMESGEAAEMAVQLASMLVLWFTTGLVRRRH